MYGAVLDGQRAVIVAVCTGWREPSEDAWISRAIVKRLIEYVPVGRQIALFAAEVS